MSRSEFLWLCFYDSVIIYSVELRMQNLSSQLFGTYVTLKDYFPIFINLFFLIKLVKRFRDALFVKIKKMCLFYFIFTQFWIFVLITSFIFHLLLVFGSVWMKIYILIFIWLLSGNISLLMQYVLDYVHISFFVPFS